MTAMTVRPVAIKIDENTKARVKRLADAHICSNTRRNLLKLALVPIASNICTSAKADEYPTGWGPNGSVPKPTGYPDYLIGNFSGGFERMFKTVLIQRSVSPKIFREHRRAFSMGPLGPDVESYQVRYKKPAILVAQGSTIFYEHYAFGRSAQMRFNGKSMSKGVLSLACAAAFDLGLLKSLEDPIEFYVPSLKGKALGGITIRNALNMSSGVDVCQVNCTPETQFERVMKQGFLGPPSARAQNTDMEQVILSWSHGMRFEQGSQFNYNSVDPNLIALAIRAASRLSMSDFIGKTIWGPIGAESDASYLADSKGFENVEAGFNATARDWTRLGLLVAQRGACDSKQVISEKWFKELDSLSASERYLDAGRIQGKKEGFKFYFHRSSQDELVLRFGGDFGQSIFCNQKNGLVMTVLSVTNDAQHYPMLFDRAKSLVE